MKLFARTKLEQFQRKWIPASRPELRENNEIELFLDSTQSGKALNDDWTHKEGGALAAFCMAAVLVICGLPLLRLAIAALDAVLRTPQNAFALLSSEQVFRATYNTLSVALTSTIFAGVLGIGIALLLTTTNLRARQVLAFTFILSLMISPQISALAFKTLAGPASPLLKLIGLAPAPGTPNPVLGFDGIIIVMALQHAPLVAIIVAAGLSRVPHGIIEAALLDGAKPLTIITRIILPLTKPHIISALLLAFVAGVGNFGIPELLGQPVGYLTLSTLVFQKLSSFGSSAIFDAVLVSLVISGIAIIGVVPASKLLGAQQMRIAAGDQLACFIDAGRWRAPIEATVWLFFLGTIFLPMASLIAMSIVPTYGVVLNFDTLTSAHYNEILFRQDVTRRAFANSFFYSAGAAIVLSVLSVGLSYALDRRLNRLRAAVLSVIEMPYALPGVVLGIACILMFVRPIPLIGVSIYATPWIILFAYCSGFLAVALKPIFAAVTSLDREIEEAAVLDGAQLLVRIRKITLPVILPSVVAGGLLVFLLAFNELTLSALLWSAGTQTVGVALLNLDDAGLASQAAALAVISTLVVVILMLVLELAGDRLAQNTLPWRQLCPTAKDG